MVYALDANIVIDYLNSVPLIVEQFDKSLKSGNLLVIPSIVDFEIQRGFYYTPSLHKEAAYKNMYKYCPIVEINSAIWNCAALIWAKLRKSGITIGDADVIIAAFCIENNYTLVTRNIRHFMHIDDLRLIDWH